MSSCSLPPVSLLSCLRSLHTPYVALSTVLTPTPTTVTPAAVSSSQSTAQSLNNNIPGGVSSTSQGNNTQFGMETVAPTPHRLYRLYHDACRGNGVEPLRSAVAMLQVWFCPPVFLFSFFVSFFFFVSFPSVSFSSRDVMYLSFLHSRSCPVPSHRIFPSTGSCCRKQIP